MKLSSQYVSRQSHIHPSLASSVGCLPPWLEKEPGFSLEFAESEHSQTTRMPANISFFFPLFFSPHVPPNYVNISRSSPYSQRRLCSPNESLSIFFHAQLRLGAPERSRKMNSSQARSTSTANPQSNAHPGKLIRAIVGSGSGISTADTNNNFELGTVTSISSKTNAGDDNRIKGKSKAQANDKFKDTLKKYLLLPPLDTSVGGVTPESSTSARDSAHPSAGNTPKSPTWKDTFVEK